MQKIIIILAILAAFSIPAKSQGLYWVVVKGNPSARVSDKIYEKVDVESSFQGGAAAWRTYCLQNLADKTAASHGAPRGVYTVIVKFIVWRNGAVSNVSAETNHGYGTENEAIRLITDGPKWVPATIGGRKVSSWRKQPVTFVVL